MSKFYLNIFKNKNYFYYLKDFIINYIKNLNYFI